MRTKRRYGSRESYALIVSEDDSVNIDSERDFLLAEIAYRKKARKARLMQ